MLSCKLTNALQRNSNKEDDICMMYNVQWCRPNQLSTNISGSIVVSILACHARDPGSIPGQGAFFAHFFGLHLYVPSSPIVLHCSMKFVWLGRFAPAHKIHCRIDIISMFGIVTFKLVATLHHGRTTIFSLIADKNPNEGRTGKRFYLGINPMMK